MKNITLVIVLLFLGLTTKAQLQEESFVGTALPTDWTSVNATSGCDWQYGYTGFMPYSGPTTEAEFPTGAILFDDATCGGLSEDRITLTAPVIDISGVSNAEIEVIYNLQVFADRGEFIIEVFDGSDWQQVFIQEEDTPRNTGTHQTTTIDVTSYINNAFQVRFIYDDEGTVTAYGLGIDNYKLINSSVASIANLKALGFDYYPNPTSNVLNLTARKDINQVNIYNMLGQEVMVEELSNTYAQLNLSNLPVGYYVVKVQVDNELGLFKILKQ